MEIIDGKEKCSVEGCENVREWSYVDHSKVHRRKFCSKHKRLKYGLFPKCLYAVEKFKKEGKCNKCELCGWIGPCDCHRKVIGKEGGRYKISNIRSICPNCHRLIHRGLLKFPEETLAT